jgi:hypothetical protein
MYLLDSSARYLVSVVVLLVRMLSFTRELRMPLLVHHLHRRLSPTLLMQRASGFRCLAVLRATARHTTAPLSFRTHTPMTGSTTPSM